jgi:diguanylate cyclase (GGDEF)-like protein
VARFGGEEFAILMPETTPEQAFPVIENMRLAISSTQFMVPTSVTSIQATMSFGVAGREPGQDGKTIIHNADMALYHAKLKGRNRAFIYSNEGFTSLFLASQEQELPAIPRSEPPAAVI